MSICTLGLDPELSKICTQGYGHDIFLIEVTVLPSGTIGRGRTRRKREEEERLIRIRIIDEDGKVMIQERLVPLNELRNIQIKVNENQTIKLPSNIYVKIKNGIIKEGKIHQIRVKSCANRSL